MKPWTEPQTWQCDHQNDWMCDRYCVHYEKPHHKHRTCGGPGFCDWRMCEVECKQVKAEIGKAN